MELILGENWLLACFNWNIIIVLIMTLLRWGSFQTEIRSSCNVNKTKNITARIVLANKSH